MLFNFFFMFDNLEGTAFTLFPTKLANGIDNNVI